MKTLVIPVVVTLLAGMQSAGDEPTKKEQAKLDGTWSYVSFVSPNGDQMPPAELKRMSITYSGDRWTVKEGDRIVVAGTQKLDPSKTPHQIDSLITEGGGKGTTMLGVYEFQG